jgi:hypothetical protein
MAFADPVALATEPFAVGGLKLAVEPSILVANYRLN